jgi:BirA family biotin operon repressor/biotin-[acetyl-CoA-carboxylase] ligase
MDKNLLARALEDTPVKEFKYFDSIGSTNDEALCWVDAGAADFSLVVADEQSKGRGRFERRWVTLPSSALAFSLILHPSPEEINKLVLFAPLCGLALRETIETQLHLYAEIKWPNDILLARHKTAGILVEAAWSGEAVAGIVLGIGVNVTHSSIPPADTQLFTATCLEDQSGHPVDRLEILKGILNSIAAWRGKIGNSEFLDSWQQHLAFKNEYVRIEDSQKTSIIGRVKGIDSRGQLILILDDGTEQDFTVGDVHLRPVETDTTGGAYAGRPEKFC